jgi:transposase-like protein
MTTRRKFSAEFKREAIALTYHNSDNSGDTMN